MAQQVNVRDVIWFSVICFALSLSGKEEEEERKKLQGQGSISAGIAIP